MALCGGALYAGTTQAVPKLPKPPARRPNLLVVFPDQMRAQAQGFMHMDRAITPNLDRLAKESHVFTQMVSNYPVCSPFRGIFMSGALPSVSGVTGNCRTLVASGEPGPELRKDITCWSDVLAKAGYDTYYIGKWHLDAPYAPYIRCCNNSKTMAWNEWCSPDRRHGFRYWHAYGTYDIHLRPMYWDTDAPRDGYRFVDQWGPEYEADRAIACLKHVKEPFAMVVSMNPPHMPYTQVPERYRKNFRGKAAESLADGDYRPAKSPMGRLFRSAMGDYLAAVQGVDDQFGRILRELKARGLDQNTVVLFTSDHGNCLGAHGIAAKNNCYEESMRIPCLIRWPGRIRPASDTGLTDAFDLAPTLLGLLNLPIPETMAGRNLADHLLGKTSADLSKPRLYLRIGAAGNEEPPTDILEKTTPIPEKPVRYGQRGLRGRRFTASFVCNGPGKPLRVFLSDRLSDPQQRTNCAKQLPDEVARLRAHLKARLEHLGDTFAALL